MTPATTAQPDAPDPKQMDHRTPHERMAEQHAAEQVALAKQAAAASAAGIPSAGIPSAGSELPTFDQRRLIPRAGQTGYVPLTERAWLEEVRDRHERLARQLAVAVVVPDPVRRDHAARVAEWRGQVRAAARDDTEPPAWSATVTDSWLDGLLDVAEAAIVAIVDDMIATLRSAHAECEEHAADERLEHVRGWQARQHGELAELKAYRRGHAPREEIA